MSINVFYKAIIPSLLLLAVLRADAQQKTTVKATVDKNKILIGQPILLTLETDIPENEPIHFFTIDTLPHFEVIEREKIDTTYPSSGTYLKQVIRITSFDSGHWVIPIFTLGENIATDSIPVDVVFSEFDPTKDYHDIKDIIEAEPDKKKDNPWLWYIIGGSALLLALLIFLLLRKKKPVIQVTAVVIDPYKEAMEQLDKLQNEKTDPKQYYSKLVDIFRMYIDKKKGIRSLQKTTDDMVVQLKSIPISKEKFEKLSQALRLSDFVKFAKYVPSKEDDRNTFETIKTSIGDIEQIQS
jgi:hypothetical protein